MANLKEIVATATSYAFMQDGKRLGVVLAGPLGSAAAWSNGAVEPRIDQDAAEAGSTPYWAVHTNKEQLAEAKRRFGAWAGL